MLALGQLAHLRVYVRLRHNEVWWGTCDPWEEGSIRLDALNRQLPAGGWRQLRAWSPLLPQQPKGNMMIGSSGGSFT